MIGPDAEVEAGLAVCEQIAARNNSTLYHATRQLSEARRNFFAATYAPMRLIDDRVDEDFMLMEEVERDAARADYLQEIEDWRRVMAEGQGLSSMPVEVVTAVNAVVRPTNLASSPWNELAKALSSDVREEAMQDWPDFEAYAEGATVAPATIFIFLLAADELPDGRLQYNNPKSPDWYARDLAIFCYLVHILRDLAKDAEGTERLLTIPGEVFEQAGVARSAISDVIDDPSAIDRLSKPILVRAEAHFEVGMSRLGDLLLGMGDVERAALSGLIDVYRGLYLEFMDQYGSRVRDLEGLEADLRTQNLDK